MDQPLIKNLLQFSLASVSIICLLTEMYGLTTLRFAVCAWLFPAGAVLFAWLLYAVYRKDHDTIAVIGYGALFGFIAAVTYDIYRVPFALSGLHIFSVFPKFGRMILGEHAPAWCIQLVGWMYHFSNGMGFGVMYMALARHTSWWWAVMYAVLIEIFMLSSPYPQVFGFVITATFLFVTLSAHSIFGLTLGWQVHRWQKQIHA